MKTQSFRTWVVFSWGKFLREEDMKFDGPGGIVIEGTTWRTTKKAQRAFQFTNRGTAYETAKRWRRDSGKSTRVLPVLSTVCIGD